jgi:RNA polymerase sigma factor (sigma-70 family)
MSSLDQILLGCQQQKAESQKQLYKSYFGTMMGIAKRYAATEEDAEEMMNNGFLKIFVNIDSYEGKGSLEGWMKRIMVNSCLDYLKQRQTKQQKLTSGLSISESSGEAHDGALYQQGMYDVNAMELTIEKDDILPMLSQLPELTKTVLNLFVFEEYTHKEIAQKLGIAERTSQWHMSNAKTILAKYLINKNELNTKAAAGI